MAETDENGEHQASWATFDITPGETGSSDPGETGSSDGSGAGGWWPVVALLVVVGGYFLACVLANGGLLVGAVAFGIVASVIVVILVIWSGLEALSNSRGGQAWWQRAMRAVGRAIDRWLDD